MKKKIIYKEKIVGKSWDNKIDNFVAHMETKFPMDDKALIKELANNIMIRDMIFQTVYKVGPEDLNKMFVQVNEAIEKRELQ